MLHKLKWLTGHVTLFVIILLLHACKTYYFRSNYKTANRLLQDSASLSEKLFLKVHLKNGDVCILKDTWTVDTLKGTVVGTGSRFDFNRNRIFYGTQTISIDNVAIFETNQKLQKTESGRLAALALLAGVDVAFGVVCITNTKSCYGSF